MQKYCQQCAQQFEIVDEDLAFYDKISPVFNGKKYSLPVPTLCPSCRMQRRMAFRNERNLYKRKCDFSNQEILSIYPPDSRHKVYDQTIWKGDKWDPMEFGQKYDFSRPFFEQFQELLLKVPRISLENTNNENSSYCNDTEGMKNSYLCFNSTGMEDSYYCTTGGMGSKDCVDTFWSLTCELCYECTKINNSYHSFWCYNGENLTDCYFCEDCQSCKNCFGCIGLRQKQYCIYNKQVTKEEYESFIKNFPFTHLAIENEKKKLRELRLIVPCKNLIIQSSEDCMGDQIAYSKNCTECFDVIQSENGKYIWDAMVNNSYDCFNTGVDTNFCYECMAVYTANNIKFSTKCQTGCSDVMYSDYCSSSEYLFGCVGLNHKKYCILNQQYSKEEYEELVPKIIEHMEQTRKWGEFFPVGLSPFGYNDTMAMEYFPLSKIEAEKLSFHWNNYVRPKLSGIENIPALKLPESIRDTGDEAITRVIECEKDQKNYKIIPQELEFYRKQSLPLPHLCPDCRHFLRKAEINPRKLWSRNCAKCGVDMQTTYAPDRLETVYCEKCYLKEVY